MKQFVHFCFFLAFFGLSIGNLSAQCPSISPLPSDDPCTANFFCNTNNMDTYCGRIAPPTRSDFPKPVGFCASGASLESPQWYKFLAETPTLTLQFSIGNCTNNSAKQGIQAAIYSIGDCANLTTYTAISNCYQGNTSGTITATGLVAGTTYYLIVDGVAGDFCEYSIDVNAGTIRSTQNFTPPSAILGAKNVCAGTMGEPYKIPRNSQSTVNHWTVQDPTGNTTDYTTFDPDTTLLVDFFDEGQYTISARYSNACGESTPTSYTVNAVIPQSTKIAPFVFCPESPDTTYGDRTFGWNSNGLPATDTMQIRFTSSLGCDSIEIINIERKPENITSKQFLLRPNEPLTICGTTDSVRFNSCSVVPKDFICKTANCDSIISASLYNAQAALSVAPTSVTLSCASPSQTLTATATGRCMNVNHLFTYRWFEAATPNTTLSTTNTYNTNLAGTYKVVIRDSVNIKTNTAIGKTYFDTLTVTVTGSGAVPPTPTSITGPTTGCPNDVLTYIVSSTAGATGYTWSIPVSATIVSGQGTDTLRMRMGTAGGNVSVVATNACGSSMPRSIAVSLGATPTQPNAITIVPNRAFCPSDTVTAFINAVAGATSYEWTLPSATAVFITANNDTLIRFVMGTSGGNLSVVAKNACGNSPASVKNITLNNKPNNPTAITGNINPCAKSTETYNISAVSGATTYEWGVPVGANIVAGQGTTSLTVNWANSIGGTLSVVPKNTCGAGDTAKLTVTVTTFTGLSAGADADTCGLEYALNATSATGAGAWSLISPASGATFQDSNSAATNVSVTTSGVYRFQWAESANGCGATDTVEITFNSSPTSTQPIATCNGTNTGITVEFDISNGTAPYSVFDANTTTSGGTVNGTNHFTSNTKAVGSYSFDVRDAKGCELKNVSGFKNCNNCTTDAGSLQSNPNLSVCEGDTAVAQYLGGFQNDGTDTLEFVLHTGNPRTGILLRNNQAPRFAFDATKLAYETTYYIAAIAGNDSSGHVQLSDLCFSATSSVEVVFHQKSNVSLANADTTICQGESVVLRFDIVGNNSPFAITYSQNGVDTTLTGISGNIVSKPVSPTATTVYKMVSIIDKNACTTNILNDTTQITVTTAPNAGSQNAVKVACNSDTTTIYLANELAGEDAGGTWQEVTTTPSTAAAFDATNGTFKAIGQTAATYRFRYTVGSGNCSAQSLVEVKVNAAPIADAGKDDTIRCNHLEAILGGTNTTTGNDVTYLWGNAAAPEGNAKNLTVTKAGTYRLTVTQNGCSAFDDVLVFIDTLRPNANLRPTAQVLTCTQDSVTLDGSDSQPLGEISYAWFRETNGNRADLGKNTPTIKVGVAGFYRLVVTRNSNGCTDSDTITVQEDRTKPVPKIATPKNFTCIDTLVTIDAKASDTFRVKYQWTAFNGGHFHIASGDSTTLSPTVDSVGEYKLVLLDTINGCSDSTTIFVNSNADVPTVKISKTDTLNCKNKTVDLIGANGSSTGSQITYQWLDSTQRVIATTINTKTSQAGRYYLVVTNNESKCSNIDSTFVNINPKTPTKLSVTPKRPSCAGECDGEIKIDSVSGGTPPFRYSLDKRVYINSPNLRGLCSGNYTVHLIDNAGCELSTLTQIPIKEKLAVDLGAAEKTINLGESELLEALVTPSDTVVKTITWTPAMSDTLKQIVTPTQNTEYIITVADSQGCKATAKKLIRVKQDQPVFMPNSFSPNGDGANDMLFPQSSKAVIAIHTFKVFDRWGELVFQKDNVQLENPNDGWNGMFRNTNAPQGVYVYWIEVEFLGGKRIILSGDITLLR